MKDSIGQEINVGDIATFTDSNGMIQVCPVQKVAKKRVQIDDDLIDPATVVVITNNLKVVRGEAVILSNETHETLIEQSHAIAECCHCGSHALTCEHCGVNVNDG